LGHHAIGRHSVASQAATGGESIKAIQAQLGHRSEQSTHKYAHLGTKAQLHVVESLAPTSPPHSEPRVNALSDGVQPAGQSPAASTKRSDVNLVSTGEESSMGAVS